MRIALLILAALALLIAVLFLRPDADRDAVIKTYQAPDSRFLTLPDGAIAHVRIAGPNGAPALVLLHGFASSAWAWDGWSDALSDRWRVIRVDLLGHGLTKLAPGGGAWRPAQVRFVGEVLDALGVEKAALAGNSMGGGVAWSFAGAHPERVTALVLVDSAGPSPDGPPQRVREMTRAWYAPLLRFAFRWAGGTPLMRMSMRSGVADPRLVRDADVARTDLFWRLHRGELIRGFSGAPVQGEPPPLSAISAPTLVMQGGEDRLVPRAAADALVAGIKGAKLIVYPGLGHTPHQEDPAKTAADARAFLEGLR